MAKILIHTNFKHDCSDWLEQYNAEPPFGAPHFRAGDEVDVPDAMADYFKRAGWASDPGGQPVIPDPTKPVYVQPDDIKITPSDSN